MIKVAHIVPVVYPKIDTDYHMLLTHLCNDNRYVQGYHNIKGYKILDNSAYELGESPSVDTILSAAINVLPDEIVLPDVMGDAVGTVTRVIDSLTKLYRPLPVGKKLPFKVMAVPQGKTLAEWLECYRVFLTLPIDTIGINKNTSKWFKGDRVTFCDYLYQNNLVVPTVEYHLLGLVDNFAEVREHNIRHPWIRGVDSSALYTLSRDFITLNGGMSNPRPITPIDFQDTKSNKVISLLSNNAKVLHKVLKEGQ